MISIPKPFKKPLKKKNPRIKYGKNKGENAVHGSDSDENAAIEGAFHFAGTEIF